MQKWLRCWMKGCGVLMSQYQVTNDLDLGAFSSPFRRVSSRLSASVSGNLITSEYWENYPDHQETTVSQKFPKERFELICRSIARAEAVKSHRPAFSQLFSA